MDLGFLWKKLTAKILLSNFGKIPILDVGRVLDTSLLAVMFHTVHFLKKHGTLCWTLCLLSWTLYEVRIWQDWYINERENWRSERRDKPFKICSFNVKTNSRYSFLYCFQGLLDSWEEKWANQQDLPLMKVKQSKLLWK